MRYRVRSCLVGSALLAILGDCGGDSLPVLCSYTSVRLEGDPLTLLADARLDRSGAGFVLLGTDKGNVRWATVSTAGLMGSPGVVAVPAHTDGPWFGAAGTPTAGPASGVVVAYAASPALGMADLMTFSVDMATGVASTPVAIAKIPDRGTTPVVVATGSGRAGEHLGIAWSQVGSSKVSALVLGVDGLPLAGPLDAGSVDDLDCLRFVPGKGDLTLSYVRSDLATGSYILFFQEIGPDGQPGLSRTLSLGNVRVGCPSFVSTTSGYAIAWKELGDPPTSYGRGDLFTAISDTANFLPAIVLSNERVSGGDAPPVVGVGSTSNTKFTLLFAQRSGGQAWQVDHRGNRTSQAVTLPSSHGNTGAVSTSPLGTSLFATYADYASADPAHQTAGNRLFLEVTCQ